MKCQTKNEPVMYRLLSATPSPYARKVRIQLLEKGIPFELETTVPWNADTAAPDFNPLEKIPVLICPGGDTVYDSRFINEWIEAKHSEPPLVPGDADARLECRRFEVLADGICDALVLMLFENTRAADKRSAPWFARQSRKVEGGLAEIARRAGQGPFVMGANFSIADIAVGSMLGYLALRWPEHNWRQQHRGLDALSRSLEERPSFRQTTPTVQEITDAVT